MDKTDFAAVSDTFRHQVGVRRIDVEGATQRLIELAELWNKRGQEYLDGIVTVTAAPEESRIDGQVLGKKFRIRYAPFGMEGEGALEVALTIQDLVTGKAIELSRFLISANGRIISLSGEELINLEIPDSGFKTLAVIARRVINSSSRA